MRSRQPVLSGHARVTVAATVFDTATSAGLPRLRRHERDAKAQPSAKPIRPPRQGGDVIYGCLAKPVFAPNTMAGLKIAYSIRHSSTAITAGSRVPAIRGQSAKGATKLSAHK